MRKFNYQNHIIYKGDIGINKNHIVCMYLGLLDKFWRVILIRNLLKEERKDHQKGCISIEDMSYQRLTI